MTTLEKLNEILSQRIMVLDGATGTMVQARKLLEPDVRGTQFKNHPCDLKGCIDILCITRPQIIEDIHRQYLNAGADIIETNTFNANTISLSDYQLEQYAYKINRAAAQIARKVADSVTKQNPQKPRFVAGSIGPTNQSASIAADVSSPASRGITFDELVVAYTEQVRGLIDGGVDILLIETVFDTLNCKAALFAASQLSEETKKEIPVMVSATIADAAGRTLSGQTVEAFWIAVSHAPLLSIGLNCGFGAEQLRPHLAELARVASCNVSCYPNAGLPNELGRYEQTPEDMATFMEGFAGEGLLNIVGGCCGTTPAHIREIAAVVKDAAPRAIPPCQPQAAFSGLEPLVITPETNFINIGERTNVSGSARFARLIKEERFDEALTIARQQVEDGAQIIDINMDEPLLDAPRAMTTFLNLIASEPDICKVPVMIDSSNWDVLEAGLKCIAGKSIVNSISLKDGEATFIERARKIKRYGAAVVVMAFDEQGQATTVERRLDICKRAHSILTDTLGYQPHDIIFDPNILAIATGMEEHNAYAIDFLEATRRIKKQLPGCLVSGGVSNLSFSFRGNNALRETMHTIFLYHAVAAGLDMGIVNAGRLGVYDEIPEDLRTLIEDVIFNRRPDAAQHLVEQAQQVQATGATVITKAQWRMLPATERLTHAVVNGITDHVEGDAEEALEKLKTPLAVVEGPLMDAMRTVGELFGAGKMFLPQVVKSARVMKKAVACLEPFMKDGEGTREKARTAGRILLATVKGDVHDIGKNIVSVVLGCNNYEIIDLGVMVPAAQIIQTAREKDVDIIGLSGLITPSLEEMIHVAGELQRARLTIPLIVGGATTSTMHTALKIAPAYDGPVVHVRDASQSVTVASNLLDAKRKKTFTARITNEYEKLRQQRAGAGSQPLISLADARQRKPAYDWQNYTVAAPASLGIAVFDDVPLAEVAALIDWSPFFLTWELKGLYPKIFNDPLIGTEAKKLFIDANALLRKITAKKQLTAKAVIGLWPANSVNDDIAVYADEKRKKPIATLRTLRQQTEKSIQQPHYALADFIAPKDSGCSDYIGTFAVTAGIGLEALLEKYKKKNDSYSAIMAKSLADRLAEALAERMHQLVRTTYWGYQRDERFTVEELLKEAYQGIRPASGYPACPDHTEKRAIFDLLSVEKSAQITLTENYAMYPAASVCGLYFAHPEAHYFGVGKIGKDQVADYARRKKMSRRDVERWLAQNLAYAT